ncbi:FAD-binding protein [Actinomadura verrucosospora]|uniref:3-oxosteroid 1-dehydrogenase n=1 Tax=Actinomadura verrucosospora TaxID=46165 RepID=A0A7D3VY87_ACTVE|nr:FAD-binding protein [Actinomadura verrucosospora]QKG21971.1 fumarate reductase/succinate dehydrogenase flavoprotein domain-containing protein [Actinomadura verrucosospora]
MSGGDAGWDGEYDLVIVGSGGGGMAAALTAHDAGLKPLVIEKGKKFGGSTALSGGGIWIPNNPTLKARGHDDSRESIRRYLDLLTEGKVPAARLDAYVDNGPAAMELICRSKWMKFFWTKGYADYHPELEGGRPLGRSIEAKPFDTRKLGEDEQYQRPNNMKGPLGLWVTAKDYHDLAMAKRTWAGRRASLVAAWRVSSNMVRRRHMATGGRALAARLRMALKDAGIPLWLKTAMTELVTDDDGRVIGIVAQTRDGKTLRIRGTKGVLLATGGFDHNQEMRDKYLPKGGQEDFAMGARENTGDGIRLGEGLGAAIDLMDDAWWMPAVRHPLGAVIPLVSERAIPRQVIVNAEGRRFTNEAAPYVNFVHDQLEGGHVPAWFVMDAKARARYPFAQILPGAPIPKAFYDKGIAFKADSLKELAEKIGVPADALEETVRTFNGYARDGKDPDFGRGDSAYDHYYGDPNLKNPNLDPLETAPYYAFRLEVGDLGTKGGLVCDEHARVLREDGSVIDGLYVTGNSSSSVMGNEYAGPGATIGPSIVFGYIAARHAAGLIKAGAGAPDEGGAGGDKASGRA